MTGDKKLNELEKQLVPLPELVTDDVPADDPDVTEQVVDEMNK